MNYDEDPTRWTSSPDDAPELLRGAFSAARNEGPSRMQMRSLALKIAAASAGGAVAIGTVKAASAGQAVATAATWSVGKVATVVALAGTLVTGGALVWHANTPTPSHEAAGGKRGTAASAPALAANADTAEHAQQGSPQPLESAGENAQANAALGRDEPIVQELGATSASARERAAAPRSGAVVSTPSVATNAGASKAVGARAKPSSTMANEKPTAGAARTTQHARMEAFAAAAKTSAVARTSVKANAPESEITLLRRAQLALQARPREAFQLTQEHRRLYPGGEFAQERDALAIQALMRVGDSENARDLATSFIRAYPSSPHAHRFREAMGIH